MIIQCLKVLRFNACGVRTILLEYWMLLFIDATGTVLFTYVRNYWFSLSYQGPLLEHYELCRYVLRFNSQIKWLQIVNLPLSKYLNSLCNTSTVVSLVIVNHITAKKIAFFKYKNFEIEKLWLLFAHWIQTERNHVSNWKLTFQHILFLHQTVWCDHTFK